MDRGKQETAMVPQKYQFAEASASRPLLACTENVYSH